MHLKEYYWKKGIQCCLTCKYIDEYTFNVKHNGEAPHGYDGSAECGLFDYGKAEDKDNLYAVSPLRTPCARYKKCTKAQAKYLEIWNEDEGKLIPNPNDISKIK